jgi:hypothetical protein
MVMGFSALIMLSVKAYDNAPPIPAKSVTADGNLLFTAEDISSGQAVFLKYGLMNNGTIWGHGAMLGPDFSAQTLHNLALFFAELIAQASFKAPYASLNARQKGTVDGEVAVAFKTNRFDPANGTLTLAPGGKEAFDLQVAYWTSRTRPRTADSRDRPYPTPRICGNSRRFSSGPPGLRPCSGPALRIRTPTTFPTIRWPATIRPAQRCSGARSACCSC